MKLPTRFMFLTNELPRFTDASGALASRFIVLQLTNSFYTKEDPKLTEKLLAEMPGILLWALEGWRRLRERGRLVQPASSLEAIADMEDLPSPVGAFVRDRCVVRPGRSVEAIELFKAWCDYCGSMGRDHSGTAQSFGRDLRSVVPTLRISQPRFGGMRMRFYEGIDLAGSADGNGHE